MTIDTITMKKTKVNYNYLYLHIQKYTDLFLINIT
jgi:hypothetical protein